MYTQNYLILFITETWLTSDITDGLIDPENKYYIIRKDRETRGGGVCVLIARFLCVSPIIFDDKFNKLEILGFDLMLKFNKVRFLLFYRPPGKNSESHLNVLLLNRCLSEYFTPGTTNIILGDANFPDINWNQNTAPDDGVQLTFLNETIDLGLYQMINQPTRDKNILDILLVNDVTVVIDVCVSIPFGTSDHNSILISLVYNLHSSGLCEDVFNTIDNYALRSVGYTRISTTYNWFNVNYDVINAMLIDIDWSLVVSVNLTPDALWSAFCNIIVSVIDLCVPKNNCKSISKPHLASHSKALRQCISKKNQLHKLLNKNDAAHARYRAATDKCRELFLDEQRTNENKIISANNLGAFY